MGAGSGGSCLERNWILFVPAAALISQRAGARLAGRAAESGLECATEVRAVLEAPREADGGDRQVTLARIREVLPGTFQTATPDPVRRRFLELIEQQAQIPLRDAVMSSDRAA